MTMNFNSIEQMVLAASEMLLPPEDVSVSEAAAKYRYINQVNAYTGPWFNSTTPYMREPMDTFASTFFTGMAFVGPAQCAKTDGLVINTTLYSVKVDPMDMMIVCPTNTAARDFSMRRIDRLNENSTEVGKLLLPGHSNDNVFDKQYQNGMLLTLSWPSKTELAGKPVGRVVLTDRDRMVDDVEGDGDPFDLASKRTTTYKSNGMCLAESSPSREVKDLKWIARTPHEAPPCDGILGLYNRGDRRRWYWPCPHCNHYFEGKFQHLKWDREEGMSNYDVAETTRMHCPKCTEAIHPDDRHEMNLWGMWLKDGEAVDSAGRIFGKPYRSSIASFWLRGVAAAFVTWKKLVEDYLNACDQYELTGSEEALKKFFNNDMGEPYYSRTIGEIRLPETIRARADIVPPHLAKHVPEDVRFLVATVDVQLNYFDVLITGILPGTPYDTVVIDRLQISKSERKDDDGDPLPVQPHSYLADWNLIYTQVMCKSYPLADMSGRMMAIKITGVDSGGKAGATAKAYDFWRGLMKSGQAQRLILLKGDGKPGNPRVRLGYPDAQRKDSKSGARGDVPVLMMNSNLLKDDLDGRLNCIEPMRGMYRTPDWLDIRFYNELCAEIRTPKGWEHVGTTRNEAWDLSYYVLGVCLSQFVRIEAIDWSNPPRWAAPWDKNDFVHAVEQDSPYENALKSRYDFGQMAAALA
jgi:phage terminase large subunit GpA-like protein